MSRADGIAALNEALNLFDDQNDAVFAINEILREDAEAPISRQVLDYWKRVGVPAHRVTVVERATGGAVKREALRPDLFD